ncbi:MAG: glutamate racemase [Candidatus Thiodiazotropha taylori]|nr:glutamate racemase [Candidatus Thiodiazotropha taylori]RLW65077.1 MAG: glutamate racemase [gamma proteobacterium symbiont of Stewartia floridana]
MPSEAAIGIFDSGIGGLSVLQHVRALLPNENLLYVSDRAHLPYGEKDKGFILQRSRVITQFLISQNVKAVVIACNTATAAAVRDLRETYRLPIIGMEPGVKPAISLSQSGMVGVLATHGTLSSHKFKALLQQHADGSEIIICPCHGWVEAIERNGHDHQTTRQIVSQQLQPILERGVDTLVLGCTHYPFVKQMIADEAGAGISIIDTGPAVAKQLQRQLSAHDLLTEAAEPGREEFWCSAPPEQTRNRIERLLKVPVEVQLLPELD